MRTATEHTKASLRGGAACKKISGNLALGGASEARLLRQAAHIFSVGFRSTKSMIRDIGTVVDETTDGMSEEAMKHMLSSLRVIVNLVAEKAGVVETVISPSARRENERFIENLKSDAKSTRAAQIKSKKLLSSNHFQEKLGITKQAISKAVKENRMFAVLGPSGENFYPAFFAEEKYGRRNLEKICKALGALPGGSKWQFFTTPKGSLDGKTPLEALAIGKVDAVLVAAAGFIER